MSIHKPPRRPPRRPDLSPWPPRGFVTVPQLMAALGLKSAQSVYTYIAQGLLPPLEPIGPNRVGLRVEVAAKALEQLPSLVRRSGQGASLTRRRVAAQGSAALPTASGEVAR